MSYNLEFNSSNIEMQFPIALAKQSSFATNKNDTSIVFILQTIFDACNFKVSL